MEKTATIFDIARTVGVSKSTVSRVLNGHPGVSDKTKKKIQQAIKDFTYIPNNSARSLPSLSTQTVVFMVCGITNPFFSKIISLILEKMDMNGVDVTLHNYDPGFDSNIMDVLISICKEKRPKGVILLGGSYEDCYLKMRNITAPIVMASSTIFGDDDRSWFSSITIDDEAEGSKMAEYIYENGHRKIALIGEFYRREKGIYKAFGKYGIQPAIGELEYDRAYSFKTGYKSAKKLLTTGEYTCLLCLSDVLAIGAMKAVKEKGLRIPEDVSIIGFDGIEFGEYTNPVLSTFMQPVDEIVEKSVSTLLGLINDGKAHSHHTLSSTLAQGGSFQAFGS